MELVEKIDIPGKHGIRDFSEVDALLEQAYATDKAIRAPKNMRSVISQRAFNLLVRKGVPRAEAHELMQVHQRKEFVFAWFELKGEK